LWKSLLLLRMLVWNQLQILFFRQAVAAALDVASASDINVGDEWF